MIKKQKLGRGLDILLAHNKQENKLQQGDKLTTININKLQRGEFQPRGDITPESLKDLAKSIKSQGIIQPLVVRPIQDKFEVIAGERRWRAAKLVGINDIPAIIRPMTNEIALAIGLIENIQRESLTPLEEAEALVKLINDFSMTHKKISLAIGKSRSSVSNLIRLLQLNNDVKKMLTNKNIEMGHARALLALKNKQQSVVATQIINKQLSVRQAEKLIRKIINPPDKKTSTTPDYILKINKELTKKSNYQIKIQATGDSGKLIIKFNSKEELDSIISRL